MAAGSPGQAVVLTEEIDADYEPTDQELQEYAEWLGMDIEEDKDLMWIARAGLKAPLPHPWKPCQTAEDGEIFYFNFETGESVWDHPCDDYHRQLYEREKAKKRGDQEDECEGSLSEGKDKKDKKEKKEKKERKKTKERQEKPEKAVTVTTPKALEAPSALPPLTGSIKRGPETPVGTASASLAALKAPAEGGGRSQNGLGEELESSIEESLGSAPEELSVLGKSGESKSAENDNGNAAPVTSSGAKDASVSISIMQLEDDDGNHSLSVSKVDSKIDVNEASVSEMASLVAEAEASISEYRTKLEADAAKQKKELEEWHKEESRKHAKQRKDWEAEFDDMRDATFAEMQAEHEKRIREEKQRLSQELTAKKKALKEESDASLEEEKDLTEKVKSLEVERDKLAEEVLVVKNISNDKEEEHASEVAKLQKEVDQAKAATTTAKAEMGTMSKKLQETEAERDFANGQLEGLKLDIGKLHVDIQQVKSQSQQEVEDLKEKLRLKTEECEQLMEKSLDLTDRLMEDESSPQGAKQLQAKLSEKTEEVEWVSAEKKVLEERVGKLQGEIDKLRDSSAEAESRRSEASAEAAALRTEVASLREEAGKHEAEHTKLMDEAKLRRSEADAQVQSLQVEIASLRGEAEKQQAELTHLRESSKSLESEAKKCEDAAAEAESRRSAAAGQTRTMQEEISSLREAAERHQAELANLKDSSTQAESRRSEAIAEAATLRAEVASLRKEAEKYQAELTRLQESSESVARQAKQSADAAAQLEALRSDVMSLRQEKERLLSEARTSEEKSVELSNQLERCKMMQESASRSREDAANAATQRAEASEQRAIEQLQASRVELEELRRQAGELRDRLRSQEVEDEKWRGILSGKEVRLSSLEAEIAAKAAECRRLREQLQQLQDGGAEASTVNGVAQLRQEIQRLEESNREKTAELSKEREKAQRSKEDTRRLEQSEHRSVQRLEVLQEEAERLRQEIVQLREDAAEAERHAEDIRGNLRNENRLRLAAETNLRKSSREVTGLRDQLAMQVASGEQLAAEVRRLRTEAADLEAELNHSRAQLESKDKRGDGKLSMQWYEIAQHEHVLSAREAKVDERERRVAEAARLLEEHRQTLLRSQPQVPIVEKPTPTSLESRFLAPAAEDACETSPRKTERQGGVGDLQAVDTAETPAEALVKKLDTAGGVVGETPRANDGAGLADDDLDARRKELRRERVAFEELRRQCRAQIARLRRSSPSPQAQVLLQDVQGTLDAHAHAFNKSVNELRTRAKQRAAKARHPSQAMPPPANCAEVWTTPCRATTPVRSSSLRARQPEQDDAQRLWIWDPAYDEGVPVPQYSFAQPQRTPCRSARSPHVGSAWVTPRTTPRAASQDPALRQAPVSVDLWEQDALWLRGSKESSARRPSSARSLRTAPHEAFLTRGW